MSDYYELFEKINSLYGLLQDDLSRDIFWGRLRYDVSFSVDSALQLFSLTGLPTKDDIDFQMNWKETFTQLYAQGKKIILYGAGVCGRLAAEHILHDGFDFYAFCDRNAENFKNGVLGKPVLPPSFLFEHAEECRVIITTMDYSDEILAYLVEQRFPRENVLPHFNKLGTPLKTMILNQYFEFLPKQLGGRAFVDGGCYDCGSSIRFADWCEGNYSKIFAFEPDKENMERSRAQAAAHGLKRIEFVEAGLSDRSGRVSFAANHDQSSFVTDGRTDPTRLIDMAVPLSGQETDITSIHIVSLDEVVKDEPVGFIKLDIEGEEYNALLGAKRTIQRDKPLIAACVYHRKGDILAIIGCLNELVPEYRFYLRHYSPLGYETVLYAAIEEQRAKEKNRGAYRYEYF